MVTVSAMLLLLLLVSPCKLIMCQLFICQLLMPVSVDTFKVLRWEVPLLPLLLLLLLLLLPFTLVKLLQWFVPLLSLLLLLLLAAHLVQPTYGEFHRP